MNLSSIISLVNSSVFAGPKLLSLFSGGLTSITIPAVKAALGVALPIFETIGSQIAPTSAPDVHGVIAAIAAFASGDEVLGVQRSLNEVGQHIKGYTPITEDGQYGPQTAAAVMQIETFLGLKPDSWYGPIMAKAVEFFLSTGTKPVAA